MQIHPTIYVVTNRRAINGEKSFKEQAEGILKAKDCEARVVQENVIRKSFSRSEGIDFLSENKTQAFVLLDINSMNKQLVQYYLEEEARLHSEFEDITRSHGGPRIILFNGTENRLPRNDIEMDYRKAIDEHIAKVAVSFEEAVNLVAENIIRLASQPV